MLSLLLSLRPAASGWAPTAPTRSTRVLPRARAGRACMQHAAWGPISVPQQLLEKLQGAGYHKPMPIQREAMQLIADGDNVILHAATGSGKTVAFLAPLLAGLDQEAGLQLVVVTPSQELAVQIATEARLLHREGAVLLALSTSDEAQAEQELSLQRAESPARLAPPAPPQPAAQRDDARLTSRARAAPCAGADRHRYAAAAARPARRPRRARAPEAAQGGGARRGRRAAAAR